MKNAAFATIGILVLVTSMAVAAQAQTNGSMTLVANIPFSFNVGNKEMPAGQYTVRQVNPSSDRVVLQFTSKRDASTALLQTSAVRSHATETSKLVFNRYGNQYFFSMAIIDGSGDAWKALKSRAEGSMAKLDDIRPQTATVALTRR